MSGNRDSLVGILVEAAKESVKTLIWGVVALIRLIDKIFSSDDDVFFPD